jgi:uncharacterized protein YjbI with pentapeptide repeats
MGTCSYTWKEWDSEKRVYVEKRCQEETWEGSDEFCIFHDPSPEKDVDLFKGKLEEQMKSETERHNFIGYYFPNNWDFSGKEFEIDVDFGEAAFQGTADFREATFQDTDFRGATFQDADFREATFQDADFREATFQDADFWGATFQDADFWGAAFQGTANFWGAAFQGTANFWGAAFQGTADFREATFQDADFRGATFQDADFREATFQGTADFGGAAFQGTADFGGAAFQGTADFREATFQDADFGGATFYKEVELVPKNIEKIDLRYTKFLFRSFIIADLTKALFHRCFTENVIFVDCTWPDKYKIYEEKHMKDEEISFNQLETIYRDLKQNMQNHGDYDTAGRFYYKEMECRKEAMREKKISVNGFKSLGYSLLKHTCGYGEKPAWVIRNSVLIILLGAVLFFFSGVARVGADIPI